VPTRRAARGPGKARGARGPRSARCRTEAPRRARRWATSPSFVAAFDDELEPAPKRNRHQIVDDAAIVVEQQRVAHPPVGQAPRDRPAPRSRAARAVAPRSGHLPHMRNVEEARLGPAYAGARRYAGRVLHRHVVAGERHHLGRRARCAGMERRSAAKPRFPRKPTGRTSVAADTRAGPPEMPPLSLSPERFTAPGPAAGPAAYSFGERGYDRPCFPERPLRLAVRLPESFRGGLLLRRRAHLFDEATAVSPAGVSSAKTCVSLRRRAANPIPLSVRGNSCRTRSPAGFPGKPTVMF